MMERKKRPIGFDVLRSTPLMDIIFESGHAVQLRWSVSMIEALMSELKDAGLSDGLIEKLRAKFYEQLK